MLVGLLALAAGPASAAVVGESEPNDTFATAQVLAASDFTMEANPDIEFSTALPHVTILSGGVSSVDMYRFTTTRPGIIVADIDSAPQFTDFDTTLELFDSSFSSIAFSDDNGFDSGDGGDLIGGGFNSKIITGVLPAGDYYVQVNEFFGDTAHTYTLHISAEAKTVPEPMTATVFGVSCVLAAGVEWLRRRRKAC
jgi:hypothetical protein